MLMKGLLVVGAILLLAQNSYAESKKEGTERTGYAGDRVIVEIEISEKKYFYVDSTQIGFFPDEAQNLCESFNMTLVKFETESKWLTILNWIGNSPYSDLWFWTGAVRDAGNATWYWADTGAEIVDFFWAPGQPGLDTSIKACMDFKYSFGGWLDDKCDTTKLNAMCEL